MWGWDVGMGWDMEVGMIIGGWRMGEGTSGPVFDPIR